eukprot:gnl/MRDRNA2_/MRDRNA2_99001_c0_seq1.p1 gnl/MRDRNA2_/MRDRNA2_99001_c0~~gnl/MRDRNA2_/MRDRNA2_99001_c0_seq1.p1  ORF type:complete len:338 (-),score=80.51 gnl/MRDRNA2_/MRDRNA2_99001_c0_seq1:132-1145(-)
MMLRVTAIIPLCLMVDANVLQRTVNRNSMDEMVDKVASTVVNRLLSRVVDASFHHAAYLDDATIAKPRHRTKTNVPLQSTAHTISKPTKKRGYFARMFGRQRNVAESGEPGSTIRPSLRPEVRDVSKPTKNCGYFARMFGRKREPAESDSTSVDTFEKAKIASLPDDSDLKEAPMTAADGASTKESLEFPADAMPQRAGLANDEPIQVTPADSKTGIAEKEHAEVENVLQVAQTLQSKELPTPFQRGFLSPRKYIKPSEEEEQMLSSERRKSWESSMNVDVNSSPVRPIAAAAVQYPALAPEIVDKSDTMTGEDLKHSEKASDASREEDLDYLIPSV